jgi:hypothetical protein
MPRRSTRGQGARRRLTKQQWARIGLVTAILGVLAIAGIPAAVLSWRSAFAATDSTAANGGVLSPSGVLSGALAVVGLALLAAGLVGLVGMVRAQRESAAPASFSALLLERPAALLALLGVAVLACAALAT